MTFRHLADPDPPEATPVHRARVGARARRLGYRRRLLPVVLFLPVLVAGGALALAGGSPPGDRVGVVASGSGGEAPADTTVEPTTTTAPSPTTSSSSTTTTTTTTPPAVQPTCSPNPTAEVLPPDFEVWLTLDKTVVAVGEPLVITVHGRHNGSEPFEYVNSSGGDAQDIFVAAEDGTVVWHARHHGVWPGARSTERFAPGEEQMWQETWRGEVCTEGPSAFSSPGATVPGRYTVHGRWRKGWWAEPVAFEVR